MVTVGACRPPSCRHRARAPPRRRSDASATRPTTLSGDDDALNLYRTNTGTLIKTLYSKKYGCRASPSPTPRRRWCTPQGQPAGKDPKRDHALRYHSLHDNTYSDISTGTPTRWFPCPCPQDGPVLSASQDRTVRLWDLRTEKCNAKIECATTLRGVRSQGSSSPPHATTARWYNARGHDKGP